MDNDLDKAIQFLAAHIWEKAEFFGDDEDEKRAEILYARKFIGDAVSRWHTAEVRAVLLSLPVAGKIGGDGIRRDYVPYEAIDAELQKLQEEGER